MQRLRIKGWVAALVICVLATMIAGAMIAEVKYEDRKEQQSWEEVLQADQEFAAKAKQALPMVERYDALMKLNPGGTPEAEYLAQQVIGLFPWFKDPGSGQAARLIPTKRMKVLIAGYIRRG